MRIHWHTNSALKSGIDGQTEWLVSHWENGFIRILENGKLEMVNAQIGRSEVLIGSVESVGGMFKSAL
jgi:hypothetical protein